MTHAVRHRVGGTDVAGGDRVLKGAPSAPGAVGVAMSSLTSGMEVSTVGGLRRRLRDAEDVETPLVSRVEDETPRNHADTWARLDTEGCTRPAGPEPKASNTFWVMRTTLASWGQSSGGQGALSRLTHQLVPVARTPAPLGAV